MSLLRALMDVIDGPTRGRINDELRQACPSCGHHLVTLHDEDGACRACRCGRPAPRWTGVARP